jgi:hypothetical protein
MRHYLLENAIETTTVIRANPLFFPVRFVLPEAMREINPASETRKVEGQIILRFYCTPQPGDRIIHGGIVWRVDHLLHSPQRKGSPKQDQCPIVITEFVGAAEK